MITASIAIGVFGTGAGLGAVIAARSHPVEEGALRLAAGTYLLDESAQAWTAREPAGGDPAAPLSGAAKGSGAGDPRLCLTATVDGHAVGGSGGGCVSFAVLASAIAPLQRPGDRKSTTAPSPKKASSAPDPKRSTAAQPVPQRQAAPVQNAPVPARTTAVQAPSAKTVREPAPAPTKKVSGSITESGSKIEQPVKQVAVNSPEKQPTTSSAPRTGSRGPTTTQFTPQPTTPTAPTGTAQPPAPPATAKPNRPTATPRPPHPRGHHRPNLSTSPAPRQGQPSNTATPSQPAPKNLPSTGPSQGAQLPTPDPQLQNPSQTNNGDTQLPTAEPDGRNPSQPTDGAVPPTTRPAPNGEITGGDDSLPIFRDPELLRRAQEALGLDKNMRYTDENGVWDLNIAPPGTPPCRDYSAAELQGLDRSQGGSPAIPRDSCQWPAFIRWLYADPAPGQISNWTKLTGLPARNLELVVTNPSTLPPVSPDDSQAEPDQGARPDTGQDQLEQAIQPDNRQVQQDQAVQPDNRQFQQDQSVQPDNHQFQQEQAARPDNRRPQQEQAARPDNRQFQQEQSVRPDNHQFQQEQSEYTGP
ncbi:hypothetical protein OHA77_21540 [Streptosporangium sp. NBC_01639]|uniref:hypothetical protein n=1 Tax=Streptosporangium sp. NBC_01639 TaxID=2975948 RepID=UPI003869086C|nr:hypothetical protein OHA77_21540 [Streptosporangium sp. NBC_01639]